MQSPDEGGRPSWSLVLFALVLFYTGVFVTIGLIGFKFPLPLLISFFVFAAIPAGLIAVGIISLLNMLAMRQGFRLRLARPTGMISAFIATTVIVSAWFVTEFEQWAREGTEEIVTTVVERVPDDYPPQERRRLEAAVRRFWTGYLDQVMEDGSGSIEEDSPLLDNYNKIVTTVVEEKALSVTGARRLTRELEAVFPPQPQTAPPAATYPAESGHAD